MQEPRTIEFKATYWSYEETEEDELFIHVSGITSNRKSVQVRIEGFTPFVYLELPLKVRGRTIGWNKSLCKSTFNYFKERMGKDAPLTYKMEIKYNLYFKEKMYMLNMTFPTHKATRKFNSICYRSRNLYIPDVGSFSGGDFKINEHNIDPIIKYTAYRKLELANWLKITETISAFEESSSVEERKFSNADIDLYARWDDVSKWEGPKDIIIRPKYCSFDIECHSENPDAKLPDPLNPRNIVFQIAVIFGYLGEPEQEKYALSMFNPFEIKGAIVKRFETEKDLLLYFIRLIREKNPDIFITYNGMKFDWNYMMVRAKKFGFFPKFMNMSRIIGEKAEEKEGRWSSAAYGQQLFLYPDDRGRVNVDVLCEIERNYKLPTYSLNAVAEYFLKDTKDDVSPRQIFMMVELNQTILPVVEGKLVSTKKLKKIKRLVAEIMPKRKTHGVIRSLRRKLLRASPDTIEGLVREGITIILRYCVKDTILPIDLMLKLNLWTTMEQMTNVMHVPMSYLHTRGQQIKVVAQIYRETLYQNIVIPPHTDRVDNTVDFQGAIVIKAVPGDYDNIATLDFASLYPTTMIAFNICYTTLVGDDDPIPDEECHVLEWSDHVRCLMPDTQVTLNNRSESILTLMKANEQVYALDEERENVKLFQQVNGFNQGKKKCIRLTFEDGTELECTPDHKILGSEKEWQEAQNIEIGQCVKMSIRFPNFALNDYTFDFADEKYSGTRCIKLMQLFGLILSDGHCVKGRTKVYTGHPLDVESVQKDIKELFHKHIEPRKENYGWSFLIPGKYGIAFRKMRGIKLGSRAEGRCFPDFLFEDDTPDAVIRAFLSGLFGGDGHTLTYSEKAKALSPLKFSWSSDTPEELEEVFEKLTLLLQRVGLNPTVTRISSSTILRIPIDEALLFHSEIGFTHCVHKAIRLEAGCFYLRYRSSVWEQQKRIVEKVRSLREEKRKTKTRFKIQDLVDMAVNEEKFKYHEYYASPTASQMTDLLRSRKKWEKPVFSTKHFPSPMEYMEKIGARELFYHEKTKGSTQYSVHIDSDVLPTFNIPLLYREDIGEHNVYDIEVEDSHSLIANGVIVHNCEHDPQKRKAGKNKKVLCKDHRYRFRKVKIVIHDDGSVEYQNEGLMPRLERNLLSARKKVKKEMYAAEARHKMQTGNATEKDIKYYKKNGWEIIEPGSLGEKEATVLEVMCGVLDAKQLAIKVSANSAYGILGAKKGFIPLIPGAASVTAMGRRLITMAIDKILKEWPDSELVYGDTDSCMMKFLGNLKECFAQAKKAAKVATHYLKCWIIGVDEDFTVTDTVTGEKYRLDEIESTDEAFENLSYDDKIKVLAYEANPIDLEFECMYIRFVQLTKKRYVAYVGNEDGKVIDIIKKGVVLKRRDNCQYLRDTYKKMMFAVLDRKSEEVVMSILYDRVDALFTRRISDAHLIIYMGVGIIQNYAKREHEGEGRNKEIKYFIDRNGDPLYPNDIEGPMDCRLIYPNLPQVLLALKMWRRGTRIPPNTRLEYLYLENPSATHQGQKAEDFTYYKENKDIENFKPDYLHYVEKQLMKPVKELLVMKYPRPMIIYEKLETAFERTMNNTAISAFKRNYVMNSVKKFSKSRPSKGRVQYLDDEYIIGWDALEQECGGTWVTNCKKKPIRSYPCHEKIKGGLKERKKVMEERSLDLIKRVTDFSRKVNEPIPLAPDRDFSEYSTTCRKDAKVEYILKNISEKVVVGTRNFNPNNVREAELIGVCRKWHNRVVLDRIYRYYGMTKRRVRRPTQFGLKLRPNTQVILLRDVETNKKGDLGKIISREDVSPKIALFDIMMDGESKMTLKGVPRKYISTRYMKDGKIMEDILKARSYYREIVVILSEIFSQLDM